MKKIRKKLLGQIVITSLFTTIALISFLRISVEIFEREIIGLDSSVTQIIYSLRSPGLTKIMALFTFLGNPAFLGLLFIIFLGWIYSKRPKDALIYSGIFLSGVLVNIFLKYFFERPRPLGIPILHENSYSFPSGHAMNSFVFYFALVYFIFRETGNKKLLLLGNIVASALVLLVGISRVYLGVHFPSDVLGGYIAGFVWLISAILFDKVVIFERIKREKR